MLQLQQKEITQGLDRTQYIGGSEVAAILQADKYKTPLSVYHAKTAITKDADNRAMKRGRMMEKLLFEYYLEMFPQDSIMNSDQGYGIFYQDSENRFMAGNLDAINKTKNLIVEFKTSKFMDSERWGDEGTDLVPAEYYLQSMYYMMLSSYRKTHLLCYFLMTDETRLYEINYSETVAKGIKKHVMAFWNNHIQKRVPPDPLDARDIRFLHDNTKLYTPASQEILTAISKYRELHQQAKEINDQKNSLSDMLKLYINYNSGIKDEFDNILVDYKTYRRKKFNVEEFKKENYEVFQIFIEEQEERRLNIKKTG